MRGKLFVGVACSLVAGAWVAGAADPGAQSARRGEPAVSAAKAFRLPAASCLPSGRVRITFAPPSGVTFAVLSVQIGADEALQLSGLTGPGTLTARLTSARARVRVNATTTGGQFLDAARTYRRCAPVRKLRSKPKTKPRRQPAVIEEGGGED